MPVIKRFEIGKGFTHIENDCLRDKTLDIAERGLLATMLSLPDGWDFSGIGLASILPCGKAKIYSSLKKLEKAGYLRRTRITNDKGVFVDWSYDISGSPIFSDFSENQKESENSDPVTENRKVGKNPVTENQKVDKNPVTENRKVDKNPVTDFPELDNWKVDKNKILNNKLNIINQSINQDNINNININTYRCNDLDSIDAIDIKAQIEFEKLEHDFDVRQLDNIVKLMTETLNTRKAKIRIAGENLDTELVKQRFSSLTAEHIRYILECISQSSGIRNIRQYLLTSLYNAPATMESYYAARERPDKPEKNNQESEHSYRLDDYKALVNNFHEISP